jgi:outer membrane protein insertion porin family
MRYPITLKASASIYALAFLETGSSFADFKSYNPFALSRSAGVGLRVFVRLLGIDFGHGFDALPGTTIPNGWRPIHYWTTILGLPGFRTKAR